MGTAPGTFLSGRSASAFAAVATVVVAVGADVVAGGHPWHTTTLGIVASVMAVVRLRLAGRHGGLFAATSAALVAQPVLHAATKLVPATADFPAVPGHATAEASVTALHVLIAALIVTAVAGAEQLFRMVAAVAPLTRWLAVLLYRPPRARPTVILPPPPAAPAPRWSLVAHIPRRGPPTALRAAAV